MCCHGEATILVMTINIFGQKNEFPFLKKRQQGGRWSSFRPVANLGFHQVFFDVCQFLGGLPPPAFQRGKSKDIQNSNLTARHISHFRPATFLSFHFWPDLEFFPSVLQLSIEEDLPRLDLCPETGILSFKSLLPEKQTADQR